MKGFFSKDDVIGQTDNCQRCGLYKKCQSPRMEYTGLGEKQILIIAEAPGKTEDEQNKQLIGSAGQLLRNNLSNLGFDLDRDFWKINAVNCRPPDNRKPTATEIKLCKPRVLDAIKKLKPEFIWLMGNVALESFYSEDFDDTSITIWRKRCIPDYDFKSWIVPLYHPSYIQRNQDQKLTKIFNDDLKCAVDCLKKGELVKQKNYEDLVFSVYREDIVIDILDKITKQDYVTFDYETSSLNPYKGTPKIFFASVSSGDYSYAFQITNAILPEWRSFLENPNVKKIAHNLKFEDKWSRVVFGVQPKGWYWDTMVSQHVLDGRKKTTGLKFQAYVRYGLKNYDKEIERYKKDWTKAPVDKALKYCGMDSLITLNLFQDQLKEFGENPHLKKGNELFFQGNLALADVENNGIPVDTQHYIDEDYTLSGEIKDIEYWLMNSYEAVQFKNKHKRNIDLGSANDLKDLFYKILKLPSMKSTVKGNASVDHSVLVDMNTEFSIKLLELRRLEKTKGTYLAQFLRETCNDGKLHPSFNLNMVTTYRSSSDKPNFQNIPVREEKAKRITRAGIIPSKGNQILEVDYGSLEVRIIACLSKDQALLNYLINGGDLHKDEAKELFLFSNREWEGLDHDNAKEIRFYAKNQKVFPYFYGSYYLGCAGNVWPLVDKLKVKAHLKRKGIRTYDDFERHCEKDERRFWGKFVGVREWQKKTENFYLEHGYVEYITGFRSGGYLTRNDLYNWIVQGPAFHCLLWSLAELNKTLSKYKTKIIGQIHDSIVFDLYPPEKELVMNLCKGIMTKRLRKKWPWLIVPLEIEFEITEIDGSWYTKKEVSNGQKV